MTYPQAIICLFSETTLLRRNFSDGRKKCKKNHSQLLYYKHHSGNSRLVFAPFRFYAPTTYWIPASNEGSWYDHDRTNTWSTLLPHSIHIWNDCLGECLDQFLKGTCMDLVRPDVLLRRHYVVDLFDWWSRTSCSRTTLTTAVRLPASASFSWRFFAVASVDIRAGNFATAVCTWRDRYSDVSANAYTVIRCKSIESVIVFIREYS